MTFIMGLIYPKTIIKSTADVAVNELVSAQVVDGEIFCSIKKVTKNVVNSLVNK